MAKVSDAHLEARRRSIVLAACAIFSRKGVEAATMAEIAAEAGLSPGAIYRYFENKDELAKGCLEENALQLEERWKHIPDARDAMTEFNELSRLTFGALNDPNESLHTLLMLENTLAAVRQGESSLSEMREGFRQTRDSIRQRLQLAKENGQLPSQLDPALVAAGLFSFYLGARMSKLVDQETDTDGQLEQMIALLAALSPQPARR